MLFSKHLVTVTELQTSLANYNEWFIPDFATVPEPLCKLTKKGVCFRFGDEQRRAFSKLGSRLASAEPLGYFDKDARTLI